MSTHKVRTSTRREQIAQAALDLVATGGLKKLSVGAVARRVGLVPSALYRHYRSKEDVLDAALQLVERRLADNVAAARAEAADPLERLHRLLMRHIQMVRENRAIPTVVLSPELYLRRPERRERAFTMIAAYVSQIARMLREGQTARRVARDLDVEVAAVLFLGLIQPAVMLWEMSDGRFDVTRHARRAWPMFVQAVRGSVPDRSEEHARRAGTTKRGASRAARSTPNGGRSSAKKRPHDGLRPRGVTAV